MGYFVSNTDLQLQNSIVVNVLKPIALGYISLTSLERNILDSYIMDCRRLHTLLGDLETLTPLVRYGIATETVLLFRTRIVLRERIERCRTATAPGPILHLPPEILSEIFRYCIPESCRPDPSAAPLLLHRINSLWQDIANKTGDLWNCLDFTSQRQPGLKNFIQSLPSCEPPSPPLHHWLFHSQKSRLNLLFDYSDDDILPDLVSTVLLPNVSDIFHLEICQPQNPLQQPFQDFFALPAHTLGSLKFLSLAQGLPHMHVTIFGLSPCLTHLSLDDLDFAVSHYELGDIPTLQPVFPWGGITYLAVARYMEPEVWLSVLSSCHSLEVGSFFIDMRGGQDNSASNSDNHGNSDEVHVCSHHEILEVTQPISLPYLRELDIIIGCGQSFPFKWFHFPALRALHFHRGHMPARQQRNGERMPDKFSWKTSLASFSGLEQLNLLSLVGNVGSVDEVIALLGQVPQVDFLDLNIKIDHRALCHALATRSSLHPTTFLVPRLSHLSLLVEPDDTPLFTPDALVWVPLARFHLTSYSSRLESLTIISNTVQSQHMECIMSMVENARLHIPTTLDINTKSSRVVPRKRCRISFRL